MSAVESVVVPEHLITNNPRTNIVAKDLVMRFGAAFVSHRIEELRRENPREGYPVLISMLDRETEFMK